MTAVGFILVILSGNFWLFDLVWGQTPAQIVVVGMEVGVLIALSGGMGLLYKAIVRKINPNRNEDVGDN